MKRIVILLLLTLCIFFTYANLTPSPASIDFGSHVQGSTSAPQSIQLTNNGSSSITITDVSISGIHPGDFSHSFSGTVSLGAGASSSFDVTFSPVIWGHRVANLVITHTGPNSPLLISLSGDATEDCSPWNILPQALDKRLESVMEIVDGKMYVFASYIDDGGPNLAINGLSEMYNSQTGNWHRIATMPNPVSHAGSTVVGDDIWIVGGFENWPRINTTDVQIYHTKTNTWSMGPSLPAPRNTACVEHIANKIYVFGGFRFDPNDFSNEEDIPETLVLDLDEPGNGWQSLANFPVPRNHMGSAVVAGKIYALGGQQNHNVGGNDTDLVHEYDPLTDTWTQKASIPFAFSHNEPATFAYGGQIIMAGGRTFGYAGLDRVMAYDPFSDTWTQICDLPIAVAGAEAGIINGELYLAHGLSAASGNLLDSAFNKSFTHTAAARMSFYPDVLNVGLVKGNNESGEVTLFTLGGDASYSIDPSSIPSWMTIDKNFSGKAKQSGIDVEYTIYSGSLGAGHYTANLKATAPGFPDAEVSIDLQVNTGSLPVELLHFEANLQQARSLLAWQTSQESNSAHFVIERRHEDEALFSPIGLVEAAGNSNSVQTYSFTEDISRLPKGEIYYRLKMVDLDGSFEYSQVVSVNFQPSLAQLRAFPNPNQGQFSLDIYVPGHQQAELRVLDSQGRKVQQRQLQLEKGMNREEVSLDHLPAGIYVVQLITRQGQSLVERVQLR